MRSTSGAIRADLLIMSIVEGVQPTSTKHLQVSYLKYPNQFRENSIVGIIFILEVIVDIIERESEHSQTRSC